MNSDVVYFSKVFSNLCESEETTSYVIGAMARPVDLSGQSIVLTWHDSVFPYPRFDRLVTLGDWVLWASVWAQSHLYDRDMAITLGKMAYSRCHMLTGGSWGVFADLSENLDYIVQESISRIEHFLHE